LGSFGNFSFAWLARGLDAGIFAGQDAAGMGQALEVAGRRLDGGAGCLDGGARGDAQDVLPEQFLEAFVRLVIEDSDFGEQAERVHLWRSGRRWRGLRLVERDVA
jgi:hypothetical protein